MNFIETNHFDMIRKMVGILLENGWKVFGKWLEMVGRWLENGWKMVGIVTNVAIAHVTIAHEDHLIKAHKK